MPPQEPWSPTPESLREVEQFVFSRPSVLIRALVYAQHYLQDELAAAETEEEALMPEVELVDVNDFFLSLLERLVGVEELSEEQYNTAQGWLLARMGPYGSFKEMLQDNDPQS